MLAVCLRNSNIWFIDHFKMNALVFILAACQIKQAHLRDYFGYIILMGVCYYL